MTVAASQALNYRNAELYMEDVRLADIATALGTPSYVYSQAQMGENVTALQQAFAGVPHQIHYSVKANSNLAVLNLFKNLGCGFDIVSAGELTRVLAVGADASTVIFSGVGKSIAEIDFALKSGVGCFNVESAGELDRLANRASLLHCRAPISLRVNPNVDAQTHPYISTGLKQNKFGVPIEEALPLYIQASKHEHLHIVGIDCHIGSQINQIEPLLQALTNMLDLLDRLADQGITLAQVDLGGGMGITYEQESPLDIAAYGSSVGQMMSGRSQTIVLEPGRSLTGNAGVLLTRVEYLKPSHYDDAPNFAVVDAAMNDLIRPALYQAWHDVVPLVQSSDATKTNKLWDIVGPICESGDFLARARNLVLENQSLLAIASAGAYGMVQASNYNSRGRGCEVLVDGDSFQLVRRRETIDDQLRLEVFA